MKTYRWATLGCGVIANQLAQAMQKEGRKLYGVSNRTHAKAVAFAEKYGVQKVYGSIQELVTDEMVDIIYISTPHNTHMQYLEEALRHGKHVLCEKSITLNSEELRKARAIAEKHQVILAEAMTIYHMPLYKKLQEIVQSGRLGKLQMVQMNFGSYKDYNMENRFFNPSLAGGALLDIGVYALSFIRWFFSEAPNQTTSQVKFAPSGVDEQAGILLMNPAGEMATVSLTLHAKQPKRGMAAFEKGYIEVYGYPRADQASLTLTEENCQETITCGNTEDALWYEVLDMEAAVSGAANEMHLDYTSDVMAVMTELRDAWGLIYPEERL